MEIPRHWRLKAQRYRLEGTVCSTCGQVSFPPRPVCFSCAAQQVQVLAPGFLPVAQEEISGKTGVLEDRAR